MTVLQSPPAATHAAEATVVCTAVEEVTHDVRTYWLTRADGRRPVFEPGQYVTVTVLVDGTPLSRCYSISSAAPALDAWSITVKRVPGGPVSTWLHDHLHPGDRLRVSDPQGDFGARRRHRAPELLLSAGSGLTPLMSMARTLVDQGHDADVVLVHHARTPGDILFRDELAGLGRRHPGIRVEVVCESDPHRDWRGQRGRISADFLRAAVPDAAGRDVLLCGPAPYLAAARDALETVGVDPDRVRAESYVFGGATPPAAPATGTSYAVEFRRSGRTVRCDAATTLLDAALDAGVAHPSSCQEGVCGTCKTHALVGTVDMQHAGGIRPREVADGKILLCCSRPTSDVVLDA